MTDKDPKDMTASELMRYLHDRNTSCSCSMCTKVLNIVECGEHVCADAYEALADKIDAELAQARELSLLRGAELWAKANGWPDFKDGEDFGAWLDRCFIPRPRFEDGEPVQFGELVSSNLFGAVKVSAIEFTEDGTHVKDEPDGDWSTSLEVTTSRLKRPAPEVLGADGLPIKEGETVYDVETGEAYIVRLPCAGTGKTFFEGGGYRDPAYLTHTPPDTLERLRDDIAEWRADCARPGSGWDAKTAEWADRIDAIIRRTGGAE